MMNKHDVSRFEEMYDEYFETVRAELAAGRKRSHWMWFIFPQIRGLGHSDTAIYYALSGLDEAAAFLDADCGKKMRELVDILLDLRTDDPVAVFGNIDAMKLRSSMTLFSLARPAETRFRRMLDKYFGGRMDKMTLEIVGKPERHMTPEEWLSEFLPAYEAGDTGTLHELRQGIFDETAEIACRGRYEADGGTVTLPVPEPMMRDTCFYRAPDRVELPELPAPTAVEVVAGDSLLAGRRLLDEGYSPAVLNFANRHTPGGGVLGGAGAQEENIFRRSDLFLSLYQFHEHGGIFGVPRRRESYPMDRHSGGIYSPDVTVFRGLETEGYPLLPEPYRLGLITVAAINRPELKTPQEIADHLVESVREKMRTIFRIGLLHGHDALVLGAWGCGAFKNPPRHIAKLFHEVMLEAEFRNRFKKIVFAVLDRKGIESSRGGNLRAFRDEFAAQAPAVSGSAAEAPAETDRLRGMLWGLVVGDCLGSPIQFTGKDDHMHITDMVPCRRFGAPAGYWTDDSSMAFCIMESAVRLERYDLEDIARNFVRWYEDGFWSSLSHAFDIGFATRDAIGRIKAGSLCNGDKDSQGNGSIMRFAPSYILALGAKDRRIMHEISDLTHNSARVRETVDLMAKICDEHLSGERTGVRSIYSERGEVNNSGWAVSTLQAALWAFESTRTFEEGLIEAVNLGGDADSIGAVFGQIAGAYYGFGAIPERWLAAVKTREKVDELIDAFLRVCRTKR